MATVITHTQFLEVCLLLKEAAAFRQLAKRDGLITSHKMMFTARARILTDKARAIAKGVSYGTRTEHFGPVVVASEGNGNGSSGRGGAGQQQPRRSGVLHIVRT